MPTLFRCFACVALAAALFAAPANAQTVRPSKPLPPSVKFKPLPPGVVQIQLVDLHCKTCARKLAGKLYAVPGVVRVRANLKTDLATITLQKKKPAQPARLWDAVIAAKLAPTELRIADQRMTAKDFPKAKKAARSPHGSSPHASSPPAKAPRTASSHAKPAKR